MSEWYWPWERGTWPTAEQLWEGLNAAPVEERRTLLAMLIGNSQRAVRCQEEGHDEISASRAAMVELQRHGGLAEARAEALRQDAAAEGKHRRKAEEALAAHKLGERQEP